MAGPGEGLAAARLWAADRAPYLATALFALSPVLVEGLGTLATDRSWRLYLDPDLVERWNVEQLGSVLVHEAHHLVRAHAERSESLGVGPAEHRRFNAAADLEINDDLRDLALPPGGLDPLAYGLASGELAETYYDLLGGPAGEGVDGPECGSGSHGVAQPFEHSPGGATAVAPVEAELIRQQVAQEVRRVTQAGGSVPAGLGRWAGGFLLPEVDWRRELGARVRSGIDVVAGAVDYSYRRVSRRTGSPIGRAVVLPALVQPAPRVAVVVDTSASMPGGSLARALAEIDGILAAQGVGRQRLAVLACDSAMKHTQHVLSSSQVRLSGGGGTDLRAGIDAALRLRPRPQLVVVVTDGFTPWPVARPRVELVVVLVGDGPPPPGWARWVRVPLPNRIEAPPAAAAAPPAS